MRYSSVLLQPDRFPVMSFNGESLNEDFREVVLDREPVELYKILKFQDMASSGGEAKMLIDQGLVRVNQEVEYRRRRKISSKDVIEFDGITLRMISGDAG